MLLQLTFSPENDFDAENNFDAVKIASKLRKLGDDYDEKFIQPLINNVQRAAADQVRLL